MRYERFFTKLFCKPVLLEPATRVGYELALMCLMEGGSFEAAGAQFEARKIAPERAQARADGILEIRGNTALIHIDGTIDKNLSALDRMCMDATDLRDVDNALAAVAKNAAVKNVLLIIDSPGGSVTGVPETAAKIAALAQTKNVFAYCEGMCCSAAYWLASQCDQIYSTSSAQMGSVGVYLALIDQSTRLANMGLKVNLIKDGTLKAAGAGFKQLTDEERAHFQDQVSQIGDEFRAAVKSKRPSISNDTMQGQSFFGGRNVDLGLSDATVADLDEALAQF